MTSVISEQPEWKIIDASKLKDYMSCPRQYLFRHILGWDTLNQSNHLVFGSAWHEAMEHLLLNGTSHEQVAEAYRKFLDYYRTEFPPSTDVDMGNKSPLRALDALIFYADNPLTQGDRDYKVLHTEIAGTVTVGDSRMLHFRMDSIRQKGSKVSSLEHKTGTSLNRQWTDQWLLSVQVGCYSHVLYSLYGPEAFNGVTINGIFFGNKTKFDMTRVNIQKNTQQMAGWLTMVNHYISMIEADTEVILGPLAEREVLPAFQQNPESCTKYFGCKYLDYCNLWPNPLLCQNRMPMEFQVQFWNPATKVAKTTLEL